MKNLITSLILMLTLIAPFGAQAQCSTPTNLNATWVNDISTFTWDAVVGANYYEIEMKYPGYSWANIEYATTSLTNSLAIPGFYHSLIIDWRVRAICSTGTSAYEVAPFTVPCPEPSALTVTNVSASSATISWTPATGYNTYVSDFVAAYRPLGSTTWISLGHTSGTTFTINGLTSGITYEYCVNQSCVNFPSNPVFGQFTTLSTCVPPTNLTASVGNTDASLSWDVVQNAMSYTLEYKMTSENNWTSIGNLNMNSYTLLNLAGNQDYQFRVSSTCSSATSAYSSTASFTTLNCHSAGNNNNQWIDYFKVGSINRISGAESGGYVNTNMSTNLTIGSTKNSGKISAGFSGGVTTLGYCIYIDFNNNGDYSDVGEKVYGPTTISNANNYNFKINIPSNATAGVKGLRVIMQKNPSTPITGCLDNFFGETEDYNVNLVAMGNKWTNSDLTDILIEDKTFIVYPNPSNGNYTVEMPATILATQFEILSLDGKKVHELTLQEVNAFQIDISNYPKGLYILRITEKGGEKHLVKLLKD